MFIVGLDTGVKTKVGSNRLQCGPAVSSFLVEARVKSLSA